MKDTRIIGCMTDAAQDVSMKLSRIDRPKHVARFTDWLKTTSFGWAGSYAVRGYENAGAWCFFSLAICMKETGLKAYEVDRARRWLLANKIIWYEVNAQKSGFDGRIGWNLNYEEWLPLQPGYIAPQWGGERKGAGRKKRAADSNLIPEQPTTNSLILISQDGALGDSSCSRSPDGNESSCRRELAKSGFNLLSPTSLETAPEDAAGLNLRRWITKEDMISQEYLPGNTILACETPSLIEERNRELLVAKIESDLDPDEALTIHQTAAVHPIAISGEQSANNSPPAPFSESPPATAELDMQLGSETSGTVRDERGTEARYMWGMVKGLLYNDSAVSRASYLSWISGTEGAALQDDVLIVQAGTSYSASHLEDRWRERILWHLASLCQRPIGVRFVAHWSDQASEQLPEPEPAPLPAAHVQPALLEGATKLLPARPSVAPVVPDTSQEQEYQWPPRQSGERDLVYYQRVLSEAGKDQYIQLLMRLAAEKLGVPLDHPSYGRMTNLARSVGAGKMVQLILRAAAIEDLRAPLNYLTSIVQKEQPALAAVR